MKGEMRISDTSGDKQVVWDTEVVAEVEAASETFQRMVQVYRYQAYGFKKAGKPGEVINAFDPELEQITLTPPMVGG